MSNSHILDYPEKDSLDNSAVIDERFMVNDKNKIGNCADFIIKYIEEIGVKHIFGIPGSAIEAFYDAMARSERRGGLKTVIARHEAAAAFMADGYARDTGGIGVCCATSGPGATNLITGVASAYDNHIPLLVITAQPPLNKLGRNALQESSCTGVNILGMFECCTHFNTFISHPDQIEPKLTMAIQKALYSRGPVHLSIPGDILRADFNGSFSYDLKTLLMPRSFIDFAAVKKMMFLLSQYKKTVFVIGMGCYDSISLIMRYINYKKIPFVVTPDAKGLINVNHPLFFGVFGFGGHESAVKLLSQEDIENVVAIGLSLGEWNTNGWSQDLLSNKLIHVDELDERITRTAGANFHVCGRIYTIFNYILDVDGVKDIKGDNSSSFAINDGERLFDDERAKYNCIQEPIKPQRLMREINQRFPVNTRFHADAGNAVFWAIHYLAIKDKRVQERRIRSNEDYLSNGNGRRKSLGGWLRITSHFGAMGWALSAALGAAMANRQGPVVTIIGDGSFLMSSQEISTAVAEKLTLICIILNDSAYGMVRHGQKMARAEEIAYQLPVTDFVKLAHALGAQGYLIKTHKDFDNIDINQICQYKGPTILDVRIDCEEMAPIGQRIKTLSANFSAVSTIH